MVRIAVLNEERCESKRCGRQCYRFCPPVRNKIEAIVFEGETPQIIESLCVGCGICVRKCPFKAISIVNLADELETDCSHRFGPNTFKLFRLPTPSPGVVLGLLGQNGIGKTTALHILSGEIKPNLGNFEEPPEWTDLIQHFRGSTLQDYFEKLSQGNLKVVHKPQYVDRISRVVSGKVGDLLIKVDERNKLEDLKEHDLAILDYLSDQICIFYGEPAVYGIVSHVHGVRVGINIYLEGYIPDENVRFRNEPIVFHVKPPLAGLTAGQSLMKWTDIKKSFEDFKFEAMPGEVKRGEVIGIFGPNGIGKTTFVKILAGIEEADSGKTSSEDELKVSYKPQYISPQYAGTVEDLLKETSKEFGTSLYHSQILQPLKIPDLMERDINELSGGELQRVAIAACLSREAELYLFDEPSAYLDVEDRLSAARTIRRVIENKKVTAFVVEHDVVAQDFIADRLMIFSGDPGIHGFAYPPTDLRDGMNSFLKDMNVTFRRDPQTKRPRVNKEGSRLDREQKDIGEYYYMRIEE
ncbi:MAG: ribosome biogenesis/translation initiation ATPase RLI [Candidatus Bathyarchaeota archaeon]